MRDPKQEEETKKMENIEEEGLPKWFFFPKWWSPFFPMEQSPILATLEMLHYCVFQKDLVH